jgi:hypothetical protein
MDKTAILLSTTDFRIKINNTNISPSSSNEITLNFDELNFQQSLKCSFNHTRQRELSAVLLFLCGEDKSPSFVIAKYLCVNIGTYKFNASAESRNAE